jgi:hypothetical protein
MLYFKARTMILPSKIEYQKLATFVAWLDSNFEHVQLGSSMHVHFGFPIRPHVWLGVISVHTTMRMSYR